MMFSYTAQYYDSIYLAMKDYGAEAAKLAVFVHQYSRSTGHRLLDVACGTGLHLSYLKQHFQVEGLDLDEQLLAIARQRNPGIPLHHADMTDFNLGCTFDVVTCLFSAIGYVKTLDNLSRAIQCMAQHLSAGGVLLIEPWFTPETWRPGTVHARFIDEPDLKMARINTSFVEGRLSSMDMHYLIGTPAGTEHYVERHELGLFTSDEMTHALTTCGLEVAYDATGLTGRGLYIGQRGG
jgi:SAM-dependent methyltransferase